MNFLRKLFSELLKPCRLCAEGVPHAWGSWGEELHRHPRTGQMVWCGSCKPYEFEREVIQERGRA